jgi:hypothetical protein
MFRVQIIKKKFRFVYESVNLALSFCMVVEKLPLNPFFFNLRFRRLLLVRLIFTLPHLVDVLFVAEIVMQNAKTFSFLN